jgi:hypothetical protein
VTVARVKTATTAMKRRWAKYLSIALPIAPSHGIRRQCRHIPCC